MRFIFARAFLQTVAITGNSKNSYTCCTNQTALFKQPAVPVSHRTRPNAAVLAPEPDWTEGADRYPEWWYFNRHIKRDWIGSGKLDVTQNLNLAVPSLSLH